MSSGGFLSKIPFSNLAGSRLGNLLDLLNAHKIPFKYWYKAAFNFLVALILAIPSFFERFVWKLILKNKPKPAPPLFILGHWRSGTTHLHNFFCLDERAGFVSTYQTVFPNNLLIRKPLQWLMQLLMPPTRPVDGMPLHPDLPQEEEFGLGNVFDLCYYYWWYFPNDWDFFLSNYLSLEILPEAERTRWKTEYDLFLKKALLLQNKSWLVSKNPPNTARIKTLLALYPDARFVHITRNPYQVFESTKSFFQAILSPLALQTITEEQLEKQILKAWCAMHDSYQEHKARIPKNRLVEVKYENFVKSEESHMRFLYAQLEINIPEGLTEKWQAAKTKNAHAPRPYSAKTIALVNEGLGGRIGEMGYERLESTHSF